MNRPTGGIREIGNNININDNNSESLIYFGWCVPTLLCLLSFSLQSLPPDLIIVVFKPSTERFFCPPATKTRASCNSGCFSPWSLNITHFDRRLTHSWSCTSVVSLQYHMGQWVFIALWLQTEMWSVWQLLRQMLVQDRRASGWSSGCALVLNKGFTRACFYQY